MGHSHLIDMCEECDERGCAICAEEEICRPFNTTGADGSECADFVCTRDADTCYTERAIAAAEAREDR